MICADRCQGKQPFPPVRIPRQSPTEHPACTRLRPPCAPPAAERADRQRRAVGHRRLQRHGKAAGRLRGFEPRPDIVCGVHALSGGALRRPLGSGPVPGDRPRQAGQVDRAPAAVVIEAAGLWSTSGSCGHRRSKTREAPAPPSRAVVMNRVFCSSYVRPRPQAGLRWGGPRRRAGTRRRAQKGHRPAASRPGPGSQRREPAG